MDLSNFPKLNLPKFDLPKIKLPELNLKKIKIPKLTIGDISLDVPIIQGGMGVNISLSKLASAVSREGGLGVIAANCIGFLRDDFAKDGKEANRLALISEIRKARQMTTGPIGVNIMVAVNDFHELLNTCIEEKVDVIIMGAGLPIRNIPVEKIRAANVKAMPIVSSARAAKLIFSYWDKNYHDIPDGVVVEGPKAGGHLGFKEEQIFDEAYALENLVPDVLAVIQQFEKLYEKKIPVVAAGGIYTGQDIQRFIEMGASGVQMGTRFVATDECAASPAFKDLYVQAKEEDVVIIKSPVGLPGRALNNQFLEEVEHDKKKINCPWHCLADCNIEKANYCISIALNNASMGKFSYGFAFCGANVHRINCIMPVKELMTSLKNELLNALEAKSITLWQEYKNALENLYAKRNEFSHAIGKGLKLLEDEYKKVVQLGSSICSSKLTQIQSTFASIQNEYDQYLEKVNQLSQRLNQLIHL